MNTFALFSFLFVCFQASSAYLERPAYGLGLGKCGCGGALGYGLGGYGDLAYPAAGWADGYGFGLDGYGFGGLDAYGGRGEGNVAVVGALPVAGTTAVAGQVPIMGAVRFGGDVCAGGSVSIAGKCACGGCGCGYDAPYLY